MSRVTLIQHIKGIVPINHVSNGKPNERSKEGCNNPYTRFIAPHRIPSLSDAKRVISNCLSVEALLKLLHTSAIC